MDFFNSFFQNVKDKLTSPFFGTLSFILLVHHWEFWYTLFNMDSKLNLTQKIEVLRFVGKKEFHWTNLLEDVGWTILIVAAGYGIIIGTRSLSLFIDFRIMPAITKEIVNKNVVVKSQYDELFHERDSYAERYEVERNKVREQSKSIDQQAEAIKTQNARIGDLNDQNTDFNSKITSLNGTVTQLNNKNSHLNSEIAGQESQISSLNESIQLLETSANRDQINLELYRTIFFDIENYSYWKDIDRFPTSIENIVISIKEAGLWSGFKSVVSYSRRGGSIGTDIYLQLQDFKVVTNDGMDRLTSLGHILSENIERFDSDK